MLEVSRGSPSRIRASEESERGKYDATEVAILATSPDNARIKKKWKVIIQVKIRRGWERYMLTLQARIATMM